MELIEYQITSKTGRLSTCEDGMFYDPNFVAVVDGATTVDELRFEGKTGGIVARNAILEKISELPPEVTGVKAVELLTVALEEQYKQRGVYERFALDPTGRPTASVAIYSRVKREIWLIGDCQCRVHGNLHQFPKRLDKVTSEARSLLLNMLVREGKTEQDLMQDDLGADFIFPLLQKQKLLQNIEPTTEYAYGVIDGFTVPKCFIKTVSAPDNSTEIVLATDGYPLALNSLQESEEYLHDILYNDPLCYRIYKSSKGMRLGNVSFDDRAYVRVRD